MRNHRAIIILPLLFGKFKYYLLRFLSLIRSRGIAEALRLLIERLKPPVNYSRWIKKSGFRDSHRASWEARMRALHYWPEFAILIPHSSNLERETLSTLQEWDKQVYKKFEAFILTKGGENSQSLEERLRQFVSSFKIQVLTVHPDTELAERVKCDFIMVNQPGDIPSPVLLGKIVQELQNKKDTAIIYTDEDRLSPNKNRYQPLLKPDWSPELFFSTNFIGEATIFSTTYIRRVGGLYGTPDKTKLYDLALRLTCLNIQPIHIPEILYSKFEKEISPDEIEIMVQSILSAIQRKGKKAYVEPVKNHPGLFIAHYYLERNPLISIVICTKDRKDLFDPCLASIFTKSSYRNFEIIFIDNQSKDPDTFSAIDKWKQSRPGQFRCITVNEAFNYSRLNNLGASYANGELLLFLNNDVKLISENWLEEMMGYAMQEEIGSVGTCLLYPHRTIQHAGILLGMRDFAIHAFKNQPETAQGYMGRLMAPSNFLAVTGACMMIRKGLYNQLGGMDEELSMAGNDIDLCLRAVQHGYRNVLLPHIRLYHYESATRGYEITDEKKSRLEKEYQLLKTRWKAYIKTDPYYHPYLDHKFGDFSLASKPAIDPYN